MPTVKSRTQAAKACAEVLDADFFRALAEPARLSVFRQLVLIGRADIGTIARDLPQDRSVIARHLQVLARAGIVQSQTEGRHTFYEVDGPAIVDRVERLLGLIRTLAPLCCPGKNA
jgi:DNA-binding transcriptional ArsR family regulator